MNLTYYFIGEGDRERHKRSVLSAMPLWNDFVEIITPQNGFDLTDLKKLSYKDRIFIFDEMPYNDGSVNKLVRDCRRECELTPIAAVIYDSGKRVGYTDIDTKEEDISAAVNSYAQLLGRENVFIFDGSGIAELFVLKHFPFDERLISVYRDRISEKRHYLDTKFDDSYDADQEILECLEEPGSKKLISTYVEKFSASNYNFSQKKVANDIILEIATECFGKNESGKFAEYYFDFYYDKMKNIIIWNLDNDRKQFTLSLNHAFQNYMMRASYTNFIEFSNHAVLFTGNELKKVIKSFCYQALKQVEELLKGK